MDKLRPLPGSRRSVIAKRRVFLLSVAGWTWLLAASFALLVMQPIASEAQKSGDDVDAPSHVTATDEQRTADLFIMIDSAHGAELQLHMPDPPAQISIPACKEILVRGIQNSLRLKLQSVEFSKSSDGPWVLTAALPPRTTSSPFEYSVWLVMHKLLVELDRLNIEILTINITAPRFVSVDVLPPPVITYEPGGLKRFYWSCEVSETSRNIDSIAFSAGLTDIEVETRIAALSLFFALTLALLLVRRRMAMRYLESSSKLSAFRYALFSNRIVPIFTVLWITILLAAFPLPAVRLFFEARGDVGAAWFYVEIVLTAVFIVQVSSAWLAYPVIVLHRLFDGSRIRFLGVRIVQLLTLYLPVGLLIVGVAASSGDRARSFVAPILAAFISASVGRLLTLVANPMITDELHTGDLTSRASQIASIWKISSPKLFQVDAGAMRLLFAYAAKRGQIYFANALLNDLTCAEFDGLIAHEAAHLRHTHAERYSALASVGFLVLPSTLLFMLASSAPAYCFFAPLCLGPIALFFLAFVRHNEFVCDRDAAMALGTAEPFISALKKLHTANGVPEGSTRLQTLVSTHPSLNSRIEALRRLNLPQAGSLECEQPLLGEPVNADAELHYSAPPVAIYNTSRKTLHNAIERLLTILTLCAVPVTFATVSHRASLSGGYRAALYLVGIAATIELAMLIEDRLPAKLLRNTYIKLKVKLSMQNHRAGLFVGWSSGALGAKSQSQQIADIGFVELTTHAMQLFGDRWDFRITRPAITEIANGPSDSGAIRSASIRIRYKIDDETKHEILLRAMPVTSKRAARAETSRWKTELLAWCEQPTDASAEQGQASLPPPSLSGAAQRQRSILTWILNVVTFTAWVVLASVLTGLYHDASRPADAVYAILCAALGATYLAWCARSAH